MTVDITTTLRERIAEALNHRIGTSPEEIEHRARLVADYSRALAALTGPVASESTANADSDDDHEAEAYARAFASEWLRSELRIAPGEDVPAVSITREGYGYFAFSILADDSLSYMRYDAYGEVVVDWMGTAWVGQHKHTGAITAPSSEASAAFNEWAFAPIGEPQDSSPVAATAPPVFGVLVSTKEPAAAARTSAGWCVDEILAEDLRACDLLIHEGQTMVIDDVVIDDRGVAVFARGAPGSPTASASRPLGGPELAKGQTVSILRRPESAKTVGATITDGAEHFGPTIEIPDLATAREYVGRVALLGHRDVPGWRESIYDDAGICWGRSSGTLSIGDRDRILSTAIMAPGVTATTSRSIHDGVVIRLLDAGAGPEVGEHGTSIAPAVTRSPDKAKITHIGGVPVGEIFGDGDGETIAAPPAEQVWHRGSRSLQMPEATPPQVARVLFDIADALKLATDTAWAIEDLAAEVDLAAAVMAKAGLS